jgi:thiol:disulfide interchange protein DsbD
MRDILAGSPPKPRPERLRLAALAFAFAVVQAHAQGLPLPSAEPKLLPPEQAFRLSARALDPSTVEARFDVADGYYLYRDKLRFTVDPVGATTPALPPGMPKHDAFFGDVDTYRGSVTVRLALSAPAPGRTVTLRADSQGCADAGVCYPPTQERVQLVVPAGAGKPGPFVEPARKAWFR